MVAHTITTQLPLHAVQGFDDLFGLTYSRRRATPRPLRAARGTVADLHWLDRTDRPASTALVHATLGGLDPRVSAVLFNCVWRGERAVLVVRAPGPVALDFRRVADHPAVRHVVVGDRSQSGKAAVVATRDAAVLLLPLALRAPAAPDTPTES